MITKMQVSIAKCDQVVHAIAPSGNLFLLLLLPALRQQGLTFIAFYALQRIVNRPGITEFWLRRETGLENYEISRACKFLAGSGLIVSSRLEKDRRFRVLTPTSRGKKVRAQMLLAASKQLQKGLSLDDGFQCVGENMRLDEANDAFRKGSRILLSPMQLSFFDTNPVEMSG